ncbi:uncharacterized protein [Anomalospiza imberbis]|uniref:uncharacterized protein isoform X6 n=1 Tax=Anomalospiza imberbis TaxID=187417 RepID=UPI003590256D
MPLSALSSTGRGERLLRMWCTAAIPSLFRTVFAAPQAADFQLRLGVAYFALIKSKRSQLEEHAYCDTLSGSIHHFGTQGAEI